MHGSNLPFYSPDIRHYGLIEDGASLQDYKMSDGGFSEVWNVQARNIQQPEEDIVDIFTMHTTVVSRLRYLSCRKRKKQRKCGATKDIACSHWTERTYPTECIRRNERIRDHGMDFLTDEVCRESERHLVDEIKADIIARYAPTGHRIIVLEVYL